MVYNFQTTYTQLHHCLYEYVKIPSFKEPKILLLNSKLLQELEIASNNNTSVEKLLGYNLHTKPIAQAYAGHQFGHFTVLGDGRAMLLGEHVTSLKNRFDIQLKGSGVTRYSRGSDGKATDLSMLREYLYSYAMSCLNIKTSQSLAVITTGESVRRNKLSQGGILIRVMQSQIRFGTFEYVSKFCSHKEYIKFVEYVINRHFIEINSNTNLVEKSLRYLELFKRILDNCIDMVIEWYRVGFVHGVMNTDNMSITGETFDYGPCSFINDYDTKAVFSQIDRFSRYSYSNQKHILLWNLQVLAQTFISLISEDKNEAVILLQKELDLFETKFNSKYYTMMEKKLGITKKGDHKEVIDSFLDFLEYHELDYTNSFIELMFKNTFDDESYQSQKFKDLRSNIKKLGFNIEIMKKNNPVFVLRNYLIEDALQEYDSSKNMKKINELLNSCFDCYNYNNLKKFVELQIPPLKYFDKIYKTHCNT